MIVTLTPTGCPKISDNVWQLPSWHSRHSPAAPELPSTTSGIGARFGAHQFCERMSGTIAYAVWFGGEELHVHAGATRCLLGPTAARCDLDGATRTPRTATRARRRTDTARLDPAGGGSALGGSARVLDRADRQASSHAHGGSGGMTRIISFAVVVVAVFAALFAGSAPAAPDLPAAVVVAGAAFGASVGASPVGAAVASSG